MKRILVIALLCVSSIMLGQNNFRTLEDPLYGKSFVTSRKSNFNGFVGENSAALFSVDYLPINRKKQELKLRSYALSDLSLIDSYELFSVIHPDFYNEPEEVYFQDNTIYLFSILNGLKDKYNILYLEIFNLFGEKLEGIAIDTLALDEKFYLTESVENDGFLMAKHRKFDNIYEQSILLKAIKRTGAVSWESKLKSPVSVQNLTIESIHYSTQAPVYLLCDYGFNSSPGSARENNTNLVNSKYSLWGYDPGKKFLKELDLRIKNRWINGIKLAYNSKKELVISGFMNETRNQTINGVFSVNIGADLKVTNSSYHKYKSTFFKKFVEAKKVDKTKEIEDIEIKDCILLADDSYFILGEHSYQYTERNYDPRTNITTTTENYNYNSIIVAYFDAEGNHIWTERIPKFQHSINDFGYFSSYTAMKSMDQVYLFFNDSERNNTEEERDYFAYNTLSNNRRFQISYACLDKTGLLERRGLIETDNDFMLKAKQSAQINEDTFYLYAEIGKSRRLFSVKPKK